jgi:hypothetical protein
LGCEEEFRKEAHWQRLDQYQDRRGRACPVLLRLYIATCQDAPSLHGRWSLSFAGREDQLSPSSCSPVLLIEGQSEGTAVLLLSTLSDPLGGFASQEEWRVTERDDDCHYFYFLPSPPKLSVAPREGQMFGLVLQQTPFCIRSRCGLMEESPIRMRRFLCRTQGLAPRSRFKKMLFSRWQGLQGQSQFSRSAIQVSVYSGLLFCSTPLEFALELGVDGGSGTRHRRGLYVKAPPLS